MANKVLIPIPGRLHSVASDGISTGANEVYDDTKDKKQNQINAETDSSLESLDGRVGTLETAVGSGGSVDNKIATAKSEVIGDAASGYNTLGKLEDKIQELDSGKADNATTLNGYGITDAYTKSETYTKTEVNGLVDTPHQEYETVDAYANLPATGSKDTIYRVSNYNGSTSQVDASVYSEYAWDGSQYVFLCVKSQIGEVFDISVYNNNAKYADLAAALNGGANIPQSLQKGGMSVKFVQSSDNKYVQFNLLRSFFSTNKNDWQESNIVNSLNQDESDLDLSDDTGNVLVRFQNGGIKTKNFDSSKNATVAERGLMSANDKSKLDGIEQNAEVNDVTTSNVVIGSQDLDLSDDTGNVLVRFQNGGIKTKNFDSRNVEHYADRPSVGYENFLVQINTAIEDNYSTTGNLQDSISSQSDRCLVVLPTNYNPTGEPVRLVIVGQSSGGRIQSTTTTPQKCIPFAAALLAEGYAILQVNGTPGYTDGIETYGGMGTPAFLQSIQAAYRYVTKKYNIKKDGVLLSGWSQGGLKAWQIAANKIIPAKACIMYAPAIDLWKLMYAYVPQAKREWMCEQFGFVEKEANDYVLDLFGDIYSQGDIVHKPTTYSQSRHVPNDSEIAYILNNYETWIGYDPICWGTSKDIIEEQFKYRSWGGSNPNESLCFQDVTNIIPIPTKIFVGTDDELGIANMVDWFKKMANNAGVLCHTRYYQGGTHDFSSDYTTIQVLTKYGGTVNTNVPSWEGILFLERFDI